MQSKRMSMVETISSTIVGYSVAVTAQHYIFPYFGLHASMQDNLKLGLIFTIISVIRSYMFRRLFNWVQMNSHVITERLRGVFKNA